MPNKIIIVIVVLIVLTYFLFVTLPIVAVFLRIEPSQVNTQLRNAGIIEAIKLSLITSGAATLIAFVLVDTLRLFHGDEEFSLEKQCLTL